ncbi:MAG: tetratricopeptide (TPR) repeat protein [Flavobacteriales bacterium]|jgi:tetratricopeptide (TPR) repeat protein
MKQLVFICVCLSSFTICAQSFNKEIEKGNKKVLLGKINQEALSSKPYQEWFQENKDTYIPKVEVIAKIETELPNYTITAFMGTWCGDSKRDIPKLYSVLEAAHFPLDRLTLVAVARDRDSYKQSPGGEHEGSNIHRVPTIVLYKNGVEVNRMIESPIESLEEDILNIMEGTYKSKHHLVTLTDHLLEKYGPNKLVKKGKRQLKKLKKEADNPYQLNTYANVLYFANQKESAIAILRLNSLLFPDKAVVFRNLGTKLARDNNLEEATTMFKKAIALEPDNQKNIDALTQIQAKLKK